MFSVKRVISILAIATVTSGLLSASEVNVIPYPQTVELSEGTCKINKIKHLSFDSELKGEAAFLAEELAERGISLRLKDKGRPSAKAISLKLDAALPSEGYVLSVKERKINITGGSDAGVFYGIQTILQQIDAGGIKCGRIVDSPRYPWRGFMLDEARHFFGEEKVKQMIDLMAYYKINKFHWHLTDASGWRMEIFSWPLLTEVGGVGSHSDPDAPATFYTQEQIKGIIEYAAARHIEVIPEVDMPGHASAATKAYPQFSGGGRSQDRDGFTFNVGKEETYAFLTDVLKEVRDLFPSEYLHIGGDEVSHGNSEWKTDKHILALIQKHDLKDPQGAERYFMQRMIDTVTVLNRKVVAWDEIIDHNVDKNRTMVMWWRHNKPGYLVNSLSNGFATILCPRHPMYFDFKQHSTHKLGPKWKVVNTFDSVYAFPDSTLDPLELTAEQIQNIKGIQANVWTEYIHNEQRFDYMVYPRMCAFAESAWTNKENKDYESFTRRMEDAYQLFDTMNIYYFDVRDADRRPEVDIPVIKK